MKYFLCGNTGTMNRGCEAIVRSTVKVLNQRNGDIYLATFAPDQDRKMARELGISMIDYAQYPSKIHRYYYGAMRKIFKKSLIGLNTIEKPLFARLGKEDICLNIGGDTYCYGRPTISLALNRYTTKKGIKNILWCCSVEKNNINGEILKDLNSYKYIFAREQITYENLISSGISVEKVIKVCDPAFFLDKKTVELPTNFAIKNTVGINLSECVVSESNMQAYENVKTLIRWILCETDMSICLIPHVYSIKDNRNDYPILKKLYEEIGDIERVSLIDKEYDCEQLKYIISNCRFFVGARTHSTIAAYSTEVPTLVIGYSVKSKGIATDLFGTYENYVLPYDEMKKESELLSAFQILMSQEEEIKQRYREFLPQYKQQLLDAVKKYIFNENQEKNFFSICDQMQCTGCSACAALCPKKCITMERNEEGFLVPIVNYDVCINCGMCRNNCPVANKPADDNKAPQAYAVINKDEKTRLSSSSGGVFSLIAQEIISRGGVVFGAAFDEKFNVQHIAIETIEEIEKLQGSKYVQSNVENVYEQVRDYLENGRWVLFSGTPCQISGLKAFLRKEYENLITQDFICHGVPSPLVWEKYVEYREKIAGAKSSKISFRAKDEGWKRYSVSFLFENDTEYRKVLTDDYYMQGFLGHLYLRNSCHDCSFKQMHRESDLTLADFWGIEKVLPEMNDDKGTSLILVHSIKGKELLDEIKENMISQKVAFEDSIKENRSYLISCQSSLFRKQFFSSIHKKRIDKLINKYCGTGLSARTRRKIKKIFR